ncbi:MAG: hypothetical protein R3C24_12305 [Cyanobacteriota/Melainabacteria group bacterium]
MSEAKEYGIPLGRVLVMSGWLTQKQINWSIQLQSLLRDESISCHSVAGSGSNHRVKHEPGSSPQNTGCEKSLTSKHQTW